MSVNVFDHALEALKGSFNVPGPISLFDSNGFADDVVIPQQFFLLFSLSLNHGDTAAVIALPRFRFPAVERIHKIKILYHVLRF